ncbi:MAG: type 1 glutamine amidotransferase [Anaerolineaceae bacterium]|nr:type 1 glutamine amidotransferase [Anaerolineaceae bacterium]
MKLLFLYNEIRFKSPELLPALFKSNGFEPDFYWTSKGEFPNELKGYQAVYLSGSVANPNDPYPWIPKLEGLLRACEERRLPMLGSCFGSQVLASALCGPSEIFRRETCELGYSDIALNHSEPDDPLIAGLGKSVRIFVWHKIEVKAAHADMRILGFNKECPNHIWRYKDEPIWGIQGHPELSQKDARTMFYRYHRFFEKEGVLASELAKKAEPNKEAIKLFANFMNYCHKQ